MMEGKNAVLGVELGSTRIKATLVDGAFRPVASGDYTWQSRLENGVWTYPLEEAWAGFRAALEALKKQAGELEPEAMGISAMMHGYLAFDRDWNLLTPFRTWQNTMTGAAAEALTAAFGFNVPQRWSAAHFYQAILNGEEHVSRVAHLTTLAGYLHFMLTGVNAVGIGEASGMFPIDSAALDYDAGMLEIFDRMAAEKGCSAKLRDLLPKVLVAGEEAGKLTEEGSRLTGGLLPAGIPFCPPEGDAGTGMTATNAVAPRTGNVSAGTSIFSMVVLERPLKKVYSEIDMVTTPEGSPVAMVHCNNCTGDTNAWAGVLGETAVLFGAGPDTGTLFTRLYEKSLEGDADCGGVTVVNYLAGEGVTHLDEGRPLVLRRPDAKFTLANFLRAQLYSTMATLRIGMDLLAEEQVGIDALMGHGGLFKTPVVGQRYLAAACRAPVTCMESAGEGGPYGMALLAAYMRMRENGETLRDFLAKRVFASAKKTVLSPLPEDVSGFDAYMKEFRLALGVERAAVETN